jgi:hypothetical protein
MRAIGLVVVIGCLAACTAATPDPTAMPTPEPADSPMPSADAARELAATGAALAPGIYTRSGFEPPVTFAVEGGWQAVQLLDGFFDIQQQTGSPDVIAVQFARPIGWEDAESAVAELRANTALTEVESSISRIGGLEGLQITVENTGTAHAAVMDVPPGPLGIDPGRRLWVALFDTDAGVLAIMVGGSTKEWEEALLTAEPVLETILIEG